MAQKTIVAFSSHVARGSVGLRASALALEALGNCVWSVPTTILSHHPGHGAPSKISIDDAEFASVVDGLSRNNWLDEIDAVLFGYFSSVEQVKTVSAFYRLLQAHKGSGAVRLIVDPVIGDNGKLYVAEEIAQAIKTLLLPEAHVITPNRFELQWLSGHPEPASNQDLVAALSAIDSQIVRDDVLCLVTSAFSMMPGATGSLLRNGSRFHMAEHDHFDHAPNGLGDLTAAVFTHHVLNGAAATVALEMTTASVADILQMTVRAGKDELAIEAHLSSLKSPMSRIQLRQMLTKRKKDYPSDTRSISAPTADNLSSRSSKPRSR